MVSQAVYCERCADTITNHFELITCMKGFTVVPYHSHCYAEALRDGIDGLILSDTPINGSRYLWMSIFSSIGTLAFSVRTHWWWFLLILLAPFGVRFWSWSLFERKVDQQK